MTSLNVFEALGLELLCPLCGLYYRLPLASLGISRRMLHEGCLAGDELGPTSVYYGHLIDTQLLDELRSAWGRLEEEAANVGGRIVSLGDAGRNAGPERAQ